MKLNRISIKNFRCFRDYSIEFSPRATVLFGKNGVGKTTLIHAIHKALSFMMYSDNIYETVKTKGKSQKSKRKIVNVRTITNNNPYLHPKSFAKDDFNNHDDKFIEVEAIADLDAETRNVDWKMSVLANNCKLRPAEFREAFDVFYNWYLRTNEMPLLAYISDSFPHREDNKKSTVVAKIRALRNFGYFDWDEEEGCTNEWIDRLEKNLTLQVQLLLKGVVKDAKGVPIMAELLEEDRTEFEALQKESKAIEDCFKVFTDDQVFDHSRNIKVAAIALGKSNGNTGRLCVVTQDGTEYPFRKLPAGYKRLFNVVLDLAYRSYILSGNKTTNVSGVAIIDEIDLHLHPELEQIVLQRLLQAFPKVQFIVSTHSPLVIANFDQNAENAEDYRLVKLLNENDEYSNQTLKSVNGMDYNSSLTNVMDTHHSQRYNDELIQAYRYWLKKDAEKAAKIADIIKERYGADNKVVKELEL